MWNEYPLSEGIWVLCVLSQLMLASHQVLGGGVILVVLLGCGVVGASLHHLLDVLRLHVDGHGADHGAGRGLFVCLEPYGTRGGHADIQLLQQL